MWQKKSEVLDPKTGMHVIHLHNPETGGEHTVQIVVGHDACPHCGHAVAKTNLEEIDPKYHLATEIAELNLSHANMVAYAEMHKVPLRKTK